MQDRPRRYGTGYERGRRIRSARRQPEDTEPVLLRRPTLRSPPKSPGWVLGPACLVRHHESRPGTSQGAQVRRQGQRASIRYAHCVVDEQTWPWKVRSATTCAGGRAIEHHRKVASMRPARHRDRPSARWLVAKRRLPRQKRGLDRESDGRTLRGDRCPSRLAPLGLCCIRCEGDRILAYLVDCRGGFRERSHQRPRRRPIATARPAQGREGWHSGHRVNSCDHTVRTGCDMVSKVAKMRRQSA
jgi:hypothetical protein